MGVVRVLGIDPGTRKLGWGVLDRDGTRIRHIAHGVISPAPGDLADRLVEIDTLLREVIAAHAPDASSVESMFFSKNAQSAAKLGHARGVVLLRLRASGLAVHEYAPARIKRAVTGTGRADKNQVAMFIMRILALEVAPPADAADALAVALTHMNCMGFAEAMQRSR